MPDLVEVFPAMPRARGHTRLLHALPTRLRADDSPAMIGAGVVRFRDPAHKSRPLPPFPALVNEPRETGPAPADFPVRPLFADLGGRRVIVVESAPGTTFYGTGEACGPLERTGRSVTCWTTDCFGYDQKSPSLYQAHPWVLAVRRDGSAYGVMVETTYRCRLTTDRGIRFECEGHSPGVIVIEGASPAEVVKTLAALTGTMPMPPQWALGYQQCRWSYEPESRVREIAAEFRSRRIPCDVIWLDIDCMNGFRCFTFDPKKFERPERLAADLYSEGFRVVCMIDPGIKVDAGYAVYEAGREGDHFIKASPPTHPALSTQHPAPLEYHGWVWPGPCAFPDFTSARTREWWAGLYKQILSHGIDGVWNDMNEPAVFDGPGKSMPETCRHHADAELGGPGTHARYHNIYGMQMVRATREGIARARPEKRPFVLTRSNFLGGHRYAATWTGDNTSTWDHLRWSIPMVLNLGLSGQPFSGPDIGGFIGNATPELFARWMGIGALLPFARAHSTKDSKDHEPWSFGEECENVCRAALERRYRLLPYLYTLFHEAHTTGLPIARPVFFADPKDAALRTVDHAFLLGADVLVVCDVQPSAAPGGVVKRPLDHAARSEGAHIAPRALGAVFKNWRPFDPASEPCAELPRLYIRPGAIVPLGPLMQHVDEKPTDPLTLIVCPDERAHARGLLYEDAGDGDTPHRLTRFVYGSGSVQPEHLSGTAPARWTTIETRLLK